MPKRPVSVKRLQTMEKKLRGNSIADLRKVGRGAIMRPNRRRFSLDAGRTLGASVLHCDHLEVLYRRRSRAWR